MCVCVCVCVCDLIWKKEEKCKNREKMKCVCVCFEKTGLKKCVCVCVCDVFWSFIILPLLITSALSFFSFLQKLFSAPIHLFYCIVFSLLFHFSFNLFLPTPLQVRKVRSQNGKMAAVLTTCARPQLPHCCCSW